MIRRLLVLVSALFLLIGLIPASSGAEADPFTELTGFATKTGYRGVFAWEASQSVDGLVHYGTSPDALTESTKAIPGAPDTAGLAIAEGLTIGSTIYWRVEDLATGTLSEISSFKAANAYNAWDGSSYTLNLLVQLDSQSLPPGVPADVALQNIAQGINIFGERLYDAMDGLAKLGKVLVTDTDLDFGVNIPAQPPGCFTGLTNAADVLVQTSVPFDSHTFSGWSIEDPCVSFYVGRIGQLVVPWGFAGSDEDLHFGYVATHEMMHYAFNAPDLYNIANASDPAGCKNLAWDGSLMHNSGGWDEATARWELTELDRNPILTPCDHQHNVNWTWDALRARYLNVPLRPAGPIENVVDTKARGNPDGGALEIRILDRAPASSDLEGFIPFDDAMRADACTDPGFTVLTDPAYDSLDTIAEHDVHFAAVAEPFDLGPGKIEFVLKMDTLVNLPANTSWPIYFKDPGSQDRWVRMSTDAASNVTFATGSGTGNAASPFTTPGTPAHPSSSYTEDGFIRMVFDRSVWGLAPGQFLTGFLTRIRVESPHGGAVTPDNMPDSVVPTGLYKVRGSENCQSLPPVAADDAAVTAEDVVVEIPVLENDSDPGGGTLTVSSVSTPASGTASVSGSSINYTPLPNFNGTDQFTYAVANESGKTSSARVAVTVTPVSDAPDAFDDRVTISSGTSFRIPVIENDRDADGDAISLVSASDPPKGTAQANADGTVRYTPDAGAAGTDTFTYTITDGSFTDTANVAVQIVSAANNPCLLPGTSVVTDPQNDQTAGNSAAYDLRNIWVAGPFPNGQITFTTKVTGPLNPPPLSSVWRVLFVAPNGTNYWVSMETDTFGAVSFKYGTRSGASISEAGTADSGTFTTEGFVSVGISVSKLGIVPPGSSLTSIQGRAERFIGAAGAGAFSSMDTTALGSYSLPACLIEPPNDPPSAINDDVATSEDTAVSINALSNDTDRNGDPISIVDFSQGDHGEVTRTGSSLVYVPAANFHGSDSFTYTISDGKLTASAVVNLEVSPVNDTPIAFDDSAATLEDTVVTLNLVANDEDVDGDALVVSELGAAQNGTASINEDGTVTYTPGSNYSGADVFSYTVSDGAGGTASGTVYIAISPVNDAPVAAHDAIHCEKNGSTTVAVLANDSDVDDPFLTVTEVTGAANGTTRINPDGSITYTARKSFTGTDSFTYTVEDSSGLTDSATVAVTVAKPKDAGGSTASPSAFAGFFEWVGEALRSALS